MELIELQDGQIGIEVVELILHLIFHEILQLGKDFDVVSIILHEGSDVVRVHPSTAATGKERCKSVSTLFRNAAASPQGIECESREILTEAQRFVWKCRQQPADR